MYGPSFVWQRIHRTDCWCPCCDCNWTIRHCRTYCTATCHDIEWVSQYDEFILQTIANGKIAWLLKIWAYCACLVRRRTLPCRNCGKRHQILCRAKTIVNIIIMASNCALAIYRYVHVRRHPFWHPCCILSHPFTIQNLDKSSTRVGINYSGSSTTSLLEAFGLLSTTNQRKYPNSLTDISAANLRISVKVKYPVLSDTPQYNCSSDRKDACQTLQ